MADVENKEDLIEDGKNKMNIKCKFCGSKILDKKSANYITQEIKYIFIGRNSHKGILAKIMENVNQTDDAKTIQLLSKGIMELYEPPLATINTHLKELTERQEAVHSTLASERRRLQDLQNDAMVDALLADIATNRERLVTISNSMMGLHKRVHSLQVRAAAVEKAAETRATNRNKPS